MSRKEPQPLPEGIIKPPPPPVPPPSFQEYLLRGSHSSNQRRRRISFYVTAREKAQIDEYCRHKKRWRTPSDLARDGLWQLMARSPVYVKKGPEKGAKTGGGAAARKPGGPPLSSTA